MRYLKQSTAFTFRIGPFVDSTDGVTAETGLTIAQGDIQISKDGGAFAQTSAASPTTTHDADGWYQCPLTATDTGTLGPLTVQITMSGALPVFAHFMVVPGWFYDLYVDGAGIEAGTAQAGAAGSITLASGASSTDSIFDGMTAQILSGTGAGQARVITAYNGTTKVATTEPDWQTNPSSDSVYLLVPTAPSPDTTLPDVNVASLTDAVLTAAKFATDAITAAKIAADAGTEIGTAVWASAARTLTAGTNLNDITAADVWAAATRTLTANTNLNDLDASAVQAAIEAIINIAAGVVEANMVQVNGDAISQGGSDPTNPVGIT